MGDLASLYMSTIIHWTCNLAVKSMDDLMAGVHCGTFYFLLEGGTEGSVVEGKNGRL